TRSGNATAERAEHAENSTPPRLRQRTSAHGDEERYHHRVEHDALPARPVRRRADMPCVATVLALSLTLNAGQPSGAAAERRQQILDYKLTMRRANQLLTAMDAMTKYVASLPDYAERIRKSMTMAPAEQLAQVENDPKAMAILKQNNLTAKEYLVGVPTLRMSLMVAQGLPQSDRIVASPENVAFAKAHLFELKPRMDAADGSRGRE